jgi:hypothetical protein
MHGAYRENVHLIRIAVYGMITLQRELLKRLARQLFVFTSPNPKVVNMGQTVYLHIRKKKYKRRSHLMQVIFLKRVLRFNVKKK